MVVAPGDSPGPTFAGEMGPKESPAQSNADVRRGDAERAAHQR